LGNPFTTLDAHGSHLVIVHPNTRCFLISKVIPLIVKVWFANLNATGVEIVVVLGFECALD
jgi:hypothetical protein